MTILTEPNDINFYQFLTRKSALSLEVRTGMKFSSRGSIYQTCKDAYNLRGNKARVLAQMEEIARQGLLKCDRCGASFGLSDRAEIPAPLDGHNMPITSANGTTETNWLIHESCMIEGEEIA